MQKYNFYALTIPYYTYSAVRQNHRRSPTIVGGSEIFRTHRRSSATVTHPPHSVVEGVHSAITQLNSTRRRVELRRRSIHSALRRSDKVFWGRYGLTRTYGRTYGCTFRHAYIRAVRTGVENYTRTYGPYVRPVRTASAYRP